MDGISDTHKKRTRRVKRGNAKTKRNFKKRGGPYQNTNVVPTDNKSNSVNEEENNEEGGFFQNFFSWF
jgi:hypothetical protein